MTVYTPVQLTRDGEFQVAETADDEATLRWDGWLPTEAPPDPVYHGAQHVRFSDLEDALEDYASKDYAEGVGTDATLPNTVVRRDQNGLFDVNVPVNFYHPANKGYVDTKQRRLSSSGNFTAYTFALGDEGKLVYSLSGAAAVLTIPRDATVPFPIGAWIDVIGSAGGTTIQAEPSSPVSILSPDGTTVTSIKPQAANATVRLQKLATDTWIATGDVLIPAQGGTNLATPNTVVRRTATGGFDVGDGIWQAEPQNQGGAAGGYLARRDYVDQKIAEAVINASGVNLDNIGTDQPTPNTVMRRNASGESSVVGMFVTKAAPTVPHELTRKDYVDNSHRRLPNGAFYTAYTLTLADERRIIYSLTSDACVFTVPTNANVPFPIGAWVDILGSSGVGTTIQAAAGVTLLLPDGSAGAIVKPKAWNATVRIQKLAPDTWLTTGDILSETEAAVDAATFSAIPNTLVRRGASAESIFDYVSITQPPNAAAHGTRKDYVDAGDTAAKARANHTGTQAAATISDLTETVQDIVAAFISIGAGGTATYDDTAGTYTISITGGGGGGTGVTDPEIVRDVIGTAITSGAGISVLVNDAGDTITISSTAVLPTRQVISGTGLAGGGDLSADRTLSVVFGSAAGTAVQGNDVRVTADQAAATASIRTLGTGAQQAKPGNWTPAAATDTASGIVELATPAEAITGTDTTRAMTPASTRAVLGGLLRWWTPEMFGAKGDNVTDDTAAVQAAINAAAAAGGGRIYCSKQYVIAGALQDVTDQNAQLTLPKIDPLSGKQITIEFVGAFNPPPIFSVINPMALPDQQSMLRSTLTAGSGGAMIAGRYAGSSVLNFTHVVVVMKNLTIRMPANPTHTALNFSKCVGAALDQVTVDASNYYVQGQVEMTTATSFGIRMPGNDNGAYSDLGTVAVIGFYNGYEWAEHTHGKMVSAWGCRVGAVLVGTNHASHIDRFMTVECQRGLKWTGPHYLTIDQMDIEQVPSGSGWYAAVANVTATDNNFARGSIRYHIVTGGVGPGGEFVREAGLGQFLNCVPLLPTTVRLFDTANTTVPIAANTIVTAPFPAEAYDIENLHDPATNNDRITIKESGWYKISAQTVFETGTGFRIAFIGKNGTAVANRIATNEHNANSADNTAVQVSTGRIWLVKNDYVVLGLISSAADNWIRGETATWLELERVG